ncbi:MAG TPA: hypothetical protein VFO69_08660 [Allosphingosinicella sp.]|nr:hypothetical protein [Allosphingosinicella sp.]
MDVGEAQKDLRRAYVGGGPGVIVSSLVWFAAALVERQEGVGPAFISLFFGGMLIFPLSLLASRLLFRRAKESGANPLGGLALESTIAMIGGLLAAWLFLPLRPELVFPIAAVAVGTHYFVFKTLYGDALFWLLGGLITLVGLIAIFDVAPVPGGVTLAVGLIELLFGLFLTMRATGARHSLAPQGRGRT